MSKEIKEKTLSLFSYDEKPKVETKKILFSKGIHKETDD